MSMRITKVVETTMVQTTTTTTTTTVVVEESQNLTKEDIRFLRMQEDRIRQEAKKKAYQNEDGEYICSDQINTWCMSPQWHN